MPELPEVETVRRTLEPRVVGRTIERVRVREARLRRTVPPELARHLAGRTILGVRRLGKYLLFDLDDGAVWLVHLGMTGSLATAASARERHDHVEIELRGGIRLVYNDARRFGLMLVGKGPLPELEKLGVDPLSDAFTAAYLKSICAGRKRPIKNLLMDQQLVAGLGNIYASEILFRAGVKPGRQSQRLRRRELAEIREATRVVLAEAIHCGGSSISDYRDGEGRPGYFQLRLDVYDRAGEPCRRCESKIRSRVLSGRSTFYCPRCQV
jgi:formamidopyrimidine-DNA glycosylase